MTTVVTTSEGKKYHMKIGTDDCGYIGIEDKILREQFINLIKQYESKCVPEMSANENDDTNFLIPSYVPEGYSSNGEEQYPNYQVHSFISENGEQYKFKVLVPSLVNEDTQKNKMTQIEKWTGLWHETEKEIQLWWQDGFYMYSISAYQILLSLF